MIAAVVTTYFKQLQNLPTCLSLVSRGVDRVICCYNIQHGRRNQDPGVSGEAAQYAHELISTQEQGQYAGEGQGTKSGLRAALRSGCEYTLKLNGDVFFSRPENIPLLIGLLGDHDFLSPQWHNHYRFGSTMMFFGKTDKLLEAYDMVSLVGGRGDQLERRWQRSFLAAKLKWKLEPYAEELPELRLPQHNGIWGELLGFRHIHGDISGEKDLFLHQ